MLLRTEQHQHESRALLQDLWIPSKSDFGDCVGSHGRHTALAGSGAVVTGLPRRVKGASEMRRTPRRSRNRMPTEEWRQGPRETDRMVRKQRPCKEKACWEGALEEAPMQGTADSS